MKSKRITVIRPDGTTTTRVYFADLAELQKLVGGFIEAVPRFTMYEKRRCVVYCNEDGKSKALPINKKATTLWWENVTRGAKSPAFKRKDIDDLRGTIVIEQAV